MNNDDSTLLIHQNKRIEIDETAAFHQAGYAAAIFLGNKQVKLPPVYFRIVINQADKFQIASRSDDRVKSEYTAKIEGGRLIQSLPLAFADATRHFSESQKAQYRYAIDADVINLLVGPLAEAKYVALRDNEAFTANLVNTSSLYYYNGTTALETISEYMECFSPHKAEREQNLNRLFLNAFNFVDAQSNWQAITRLAEFIRSANRPIISSEDVFSLIESQTVETNAPVYLELPKTRSSTVDSLLPRSAKTKTA